MDEHIMDHDFPNVGDKINLFHYNLFPIHSVKKHEKRLHRNVSVKLNNIKHM
jgi:hypothetical protein